MKSKLIICIVAFAAISLAACNSSTKPAETKEEAKTDTTAMIAPQPGDRVIYQCPMDPEEVSDKPGKCPKCGMDLEKVVIRGNDTIRGE